MFSDAAAAAGAVEPGREGRTRLLHDDADGACASASRRKSKEEVEVTYEDDGTGKFIVHVEEEQDSINWAESKLDFIVAINIVANVIAMGVELDHPWSGWAVLESILLLVFVLDLILRIKWRGFAFFEERSHIFDVVVIAITVIEVWVLPLIVLMQKEMVQHSSRRRSIMGNVTMALRAFRMARAVRIIRLLRFTKPLYRIFVSMTIAFHRVFWVMILMGVFIYGFSLIFTQLLGQDMMHVLDDDPQLAALRERFRTVPRTSFELFRAMCGDVTDFGYLISAEDNAVVPFVYICFQVSCTWLACSIFTAEVVDATITNSLEMDQEERALIVLRNRSREKCGIREGLYKLFANIETGEDGCIEFVRFAVFMEDADSVKELTRITGLMPSQVVILWESVELNAVVELEAFVDALAGAAHMTTDSSILRIQAQLEGVRKMEKHQRDGLTIIGDNIANGVMETHATHESAFADIIREVRSDLEHLQSDVQAIRRMKGVPASSEHGVEVPTKDWFMDALGGMAAQVRETQSGLVEDVRRELRQQAQDLKAMIRQTATDESVGKLTRVAEAVSVASAASATSSAGVGAEVAAMKTGILDVQRSLTKLHKDFRERSHSGASEGAARAAAGGGDGGAVAENLCRPGAAEPPASSMASAALAGGTGSASAEGTASLVKDVHGEVFALRNEVGEVARAAAANAAAATAAAAAATSAARSGSGIHAAEAAFVTKTIDSEVVAVRKLSDELGALVKVMTPPEGLTPAVLQGRRRSSSLRVGASAGSERSSPLVDGGAGGGAAVAGGGGGSGAAAATSASISGRAPAQAGLTRGGAPAAWSDSRLPFATVPTGGLAASSGFRNAATDGSWSDRQL